MLRNILIILFCQIPYACCAQDAAYLTKLSDKISRAPNETEHIAALVELSDYYAVFNSGAKADSILQKALIIAEVSNDRNLFVKLLIDNTVSNLNSRSNKKTLDRCLNIIQKGLRYAQEMHNSQFEALAYIRMAAIYRRQYSYDAALQSATKAITALAQVKDADSIRIELFCELGDIYFAGSEGVAAYKNYNTASEIAYRTKNIRYQSMLDHRFAELYKSLNKNETAKEYLFESLHRNMANHNTEGEFMDYIDLGRISNDREYLEKAASLAEKLNSPRSRMQVKRLMFYWYMVEGKNIVQTFKFLAANPEVVQYFTNGDLRGFTWEKGNIYKYAGNYDSALSCFREVEQHILAANSPGVDLDTYTIADTYFQNGESVKAMEYYKKTYDKAEKLNQQELLNSVSLRLAKLSADKGNYELAYFYSGRADSIESILQGKSSKEDIALLEIDREKKKGDIDRLEIEHEISRKNNLQIMAITILITLFFAFMLFVGMFEVSKTTIKTMGYFAFISLFEFIVLLLDHPIISITQGQPLKLWLIKIGLIAMLVPVQHYMEKSLISFLQSRQLLEARRKFSLKEWWKKTKQPALPAADSIEDSTAIL